MSLFQKTETPTRQVDVEILGYEDGDLELSLTCMRNEEVEDYIMSLAELERITGWENPRAELEERVPLRAVMTVMRDTVVNIVFN